MHGQSSGLGIRDSGFGTQDYGFPDSTTYSVLGSNYRGPRRPFLPFHGYFGGGRPFRRQEYSIEYIIESTNRNCAYNPLINTVFLKGVL